MQKEIHVKLNAIGYNNLGIEWDDGGHQKIEKIILGTRASLISFIQVVYSEPNETKVLGLEHGGKSYSSLKVITIKNLITQIVGTYGYSTIEGCYGITYLEFSGSKESYGSFGTEVGDSFTFETNSGFTGFHGKATEIQVCALGVYVNSSATSYLNPSKR